MLIRKYLGKDPSNKTGEYVELSCDECSASVIRYFRFMVSHEGRHWCSPKCMSIIKGTSVKIGCGHCGIELIKRKSIIKKAKSGKVFCNRECKELAQVYMKDIQPGHYGLGTSNYRRRALDYYGSVCIKCSFDIERALEVHHIDKDRGNNCLENLEVLCANCHTLEHYK